MLISNSTCSLLVLCLDFEVTSFVLFRSQWTPENPSFSNGAVYSILFSLLIASYSGSIFAPLRFVYLTSTVLIESCFYARHCNKLGVHYSEQEHGWSLIRKTYKIIL